MNACAEWDTLFTRVNYLREPRQLNPRDPTLLHSLAEVIRSQAMSADSHLMRERLRKEARVALAPLLRNSEESSYANHTMVKLAFDDLRERLAEPSGSERDVDAALREAERILLVSCLLNNLWTGAALNAHISTRLRGFFACTRPVMHPHAYRYLRDMTLEMLWEGTPMRRCSWQRKRT